MYIGRRNKSLLVLTGLLVLAMLTTVVGCQSSNPTAAPAETLATSAPNPEPTQAPTGLSGQLQLAGSTTVQPLAEKLAEAFMGLNPGLVIEIQGGGSSVGVTSAGEGTVDVGNASRGVKDSELEQFPDLQVFTIAYDGIAIVTHPDTELPSLSVEQARAIFGGEITNFSEVGGPDAPIIVVSREEGSGTRAAFEDLVMKYKDAAGEKQEALITERALLQQSNGQVRTTVASTPNSIGYLSFGFLDESTSGVPIDDVEPSVANVKGGSYPIFRPLNMLTNGAPNELAQVFLDFILSDEGQAIVAEDYITVTGGGEEPVAEATEAAAHARTAAQFLREVIPLGRKPSESAVFPWLRDLDDEEQQEFLHQFVDLFAHCSTTGAWASFEELLEDWRATAEAHRNPELIEAWHTRGRPGDYVPMEAPNVSRV